MKIEYLPPSTLMPEQNVEIEVLKGDWPGIYLSHILSIAGKNITLDAPVARGVFVPLRPETPVVIHAATAKGVLSFDSHIIERQPGTNPTVVVARPTRLMAVQRRTFYRVNTRLPVLFSQTGAAGEAEGGDARQEAGVVVDLSGGGAALRSSLSLHDGDWLRLRLSLSDKEEELLVAAEVVGVDSRRARSDVERIVRLRFAGLSVHDEDRLFRFINTLERGNLRERRTFWER